MIIYIGKTYSLKKRISSYKCLNCKKQKRLYNSLNKYGFDNHDFSIIKEGFLSGVLISKYEIYYIRKYNSFENGMNLTLGGEGVLGLKMSKKSKNKISISKKKST